MGKFVDNPNTLSSPVWAADFIAPENLVPGGAKLDVTQFYASDSFLVTATATAAASATSITVSALSAALPSGTLLDFGGTGSKMAKLTAAAAAGATSLTVAALPAEVTSGLQARYLGDGMHKKVVKSGTLIGRTYAERDASTGFGPAAVTDDEFFIVPFEKSDITRDNDVELLRKDFAIYENFLPEWSTLNTAVNEVQTVTVAGTLSAGVLGIRYGGKTVPVAYNGNLAAIQTALDTLFGASNTVAAGTIASFTVTFAETYAGTAMDLIGLDVSGLTGLTSCNVVRTTAGGKPMLTKLRSLFRCLKGVA